METTVENLNDITKRLRFTISVKQLDAALAKKFTELAKDPQYGERIKALQKPYKPEDFTRWETPPELIQQCFQDIAPNVVQELIQISLKNILNEKNLSPLSTPDLKIKSFTFGQPIECEVTFEVLPEINLYIDLSGIKKEILPVTEKDVTESLERLRALHVIWQETDKPLVDGFQAVIDFTSILDGKPLSEGAANNYEVVIGSHSMMPGFEQGLLGAKTNERRMLNLIFPTDYFDQYVAGKPVQFNVHIKKVSQPTFPVIDSAFIKKVGIASGDKADLMTKIKINLEQQFAVAAKDKFKQKILDRLVEQNPFALPNVLVEQEVKRLREEQEHLHELNTDADSRTATLYKKAEWNVRVSLIIVALLKKYPMQPDPERIEAQLQTVASIYRDPQALIANFKQDPAKMANIEMLVLEDQVIEKLVSELVV